MWEVKAYLRKRPGKDRGEDMGEDELGEGEAESSPSLGGQKELPV